MLVMLLPGLACAMPMCGAAGHCPHHEKSHAAPMLMGDCGKIDLQAAGDTSVKKPDMSGKAFMIAGAGIFSGGDFNPGSLRAIRGPPPDWPGLSRTQPPVLLTTLRLRQ